MNRSGILVLAALTLAGAASADEKTNAPKPAPATPGQHPPGTVIGGISTLTGGFIGGLPGYPQQPGGASNGAPNPNHGNFPMVELKFPEESKGNANKGANATAAPSNGTNAPPSSPPPPPTRSYERGDESPGLPNPPTTPHAAAPAKKPYFEGHAVLFLRAPGEEDPSPAGVKARFSREAKVVKRLAPDVAQGNKPATKPEDAVLRDSAPQGFYLPDEVDAWIVADEGQLVLLECEGATFDKIAALALAAKLNVAGPESELQLDGMTVTKVKVASFTVDGTPPQLEAK